jgi:ribosomal protein S18 acetylase RimI-like enzyme
MTDEELAELVDTNYVYAWTLLARYSGTGRVAQSDGLVVAMSGLNLSLFNTAFVRRPLVDPVRQLRDAIALFDEHGVPFRIQVLDGIDRVAERSCLELGLVAGEDLLPGMALPDLSGIREPPPSAGVAIHAVTRENLDTYVSVLASGFGLSAEIAARVATVEMLSAPGVEAFLGVINGTPVSTGLLVISDRVAGVFNISTDEAYRRRGIGEHMTRHVLARGRAQSCTVGALEASRIGRPVYERIGFRVVAPYVVFRRPA